MKKKIKDLTLEECKRICDKVKDCDKCPLRLSICDDIAFVHLLYNDNQYGCGKLIEQEVEVDE